MKFTVSCCTVYSVYSSQIMRTTTIIALTYRCDVMTDNDAIADVTYDRSATRVGQRR